MDTAVGDGKHFDLLIQDNDLVLDDFGEPLTVDGRPSVAQDVAHSLRESQLLTPLIAQRSPLQRRHQYAQMEQLVEDDPRIVPGSCRITEDRDSEQSHIVANTYEYQGIAFYL